jgi:hypothetical protein
VEFTLFAPLILLLSPLSVAAPTANPGASAVSKEDATPVKALQARSSGSYTVSGPGARKRAIVAAGGSVFDLAIAMLETDNMQTNYRYGDGKTRLSTRCILIWSIC